ncbi:MAG: YbaK/EbsC family protein [Acidimicrobiales bacterium]
MHANTAAVVAAADALGLRIEPVEHADGTRTAQDAADAIGCAVAQIVKSLVFGLFPAGEAEAAELVVALVAGDNQLDEAKLAAAAGAARAGRVDAERVRAATGFPIGGVAPFGHPSPLRTFVDPDLLTHEVVWAAAGTPRSVFAIPPAELVAACNASVTPLAR